MKGRGDDINTSKYELRSPCFNENVDQPTNLQRAKYQHKRRNQKI